MKRRYLLFCFLVLGLTAPGDARAALSFPPDVVYAALRETVVPRDADGVQLPTALRYDADGLARRQLLVRLQRERYGNENLGSGFDHRTAVVLTADGKRMAEGSGYGPKSLFLFSGPLRSADVAAFLRTVAAGGPPPGVAAGDAAAIAAAEKFWKEDAEQMLAVAARCRVREAIPAMIDLLRHDTLVWHAAGCLGAFGADAAPAVPALVALLMRQTPTEHPPCWLSPMSTLSSIGRPAHAALLGIVNDPADDRRTHALWALAMSSDVPDFRPLVPFLIGVLETSGTERGFGPAGPPVSPLSAAAALAAAGPDVAAVAVPVLRRGLGRWADHELRAGAIVALGAMGKEGLAVLQAVLVTPATPDYEWPRCAEQMLYAGDAGVAALFRALSVNPDRVTSAVASSLFMLDRQQYGRARSLVFVCLDIGHEEARRSALSAIVQNDAPAVAMAACLDQLRRDDDANADVRFVALEGLGELLARRGVRAVPENLIRAAATEGNDTVRQSAENLLEQIRHSRARSATPN